VCEEELMQANLKMHIGKKQQGKKEKGKEKETIKRRTVDLGVLWEFIFRHFGVSANPCRGRHHAENKNKNKSNLSGIDENH
jgi:hypothetical protein